MRLSRYWMTGCMALVLLVAGRWPASAEDDESGRQRGGWITVTSKHSLDDTLRQLEQAARQQGLPVVAQVAPMATSRPAQDGAARVVVLGHDDGHTPMVQASRAGPMELPLRVLLQQMPDGSTRVMFNDASALARQGTVPHELADELARLPSVVASALS